MTNKKKYPKGFLKAIKELKKEGIIKEIKKDVYKLVKEKPLVLKNKTKLGNILS
jgi:biotin operon repressor